MQKSSKLQHAVDAGQVTKHSTLRYPHRLNFYDRPPIDDITIEDFETFALDRLRVLAEIESAYARNRPFEELKNITLAQCKKYLPLNSSTAYTIDRDAERRKDHVGHFVLRLAFCRSEELRRRFVKAEAALFRVRYDSDDRREREEFLRSRDFNWIAVGPEEKQRYKEELEATISILPHRKEKSDIENFYKVKWMRVPDLVEKRRVFLKGGWAYVPAQELSSIIFQEFETSLEQALEQTAKALPRLDEDTRLVPLLNNLSQGFMAGGTSEWNGVSSSGSRDGITAEMVDELAKKHFPMCMRHLHDSLRRDRHLKHFGRLQYRLFLKVLGLSIDEALVFWRRSFSKITDDTFNKEYKYNIRHSFGLEGKRANYPARSCQQIIMGEKVGAGDCHGCPYLHFSPENLQTALLSMYSSQGLSMSDLPEIMNTIKGKHYHVACTRVFEITHASAGIKKGEGLAGESVTHPNQYATKSRELAGELKGKEEDEDIVMGGA